MDLDYWLVRLSSWNDPNPHPILEDHQGFTIVRDDLLEYGSKIRFVDYLIGHAPEYAHVKEWVFGACPATGYAQISLPIVCKRYGKTAHLFMAERNINKLHPYQQRGMELGAQYHWVPSGMLNVTKARAFEYAHEHPEYRALLPIGLEHESVLASIVKVAQSLNVKPDVVWSVGSSGTLNRGLQLAFPDADCHVVSVGHTMSQREIGRARVHEVPYKFDQAVKKEHLPPFPSAPTYDAKAWQVMVDWHKGFRPDGPILFWNVAA